MGVKKIIKDSTPYYSTQYGEAYLGDSKTILRKINTNSIDLVITSPPFPLVHKKEYGSVNEDEYREWFIPFAIEIRRVLKETGSFILDLGASWIKGKPIKSLYQFKLLISLCEVGGFHLAQDIYWYNSAKLPTPAQWVTIERIRLKDAVNTIWWLAKTERPYADNKKVLRQYSKSMMNLLKNGYKAKERPSGHKISDNFSKDNSGSISPNLLNIPNTTSNSHYLSMCNKYNLKPHPTRFPEKIPEFFIQFLTKKGDTVLDPFAGSNVTGEIAEKLERKWISIDINEAYLRGSKFRFFDESHL